MKEEFSAGGVIFKQIDSEMKVLLCYQKKLSGTKVFCLPKGHIEDGESISDAALREVFEETGVTAEIIKPLSSIFYVFLQSGERIKKTVYFFLMKSIKEEFRPNPETEKIIWCDKETALKLDTYKSEQNIIEEAFSLLQEIHPNYQKVALL